MSDQNYRCWAEISRSALIHNAKTLRGAFGNLSLLAVIKANAYGHGLVEIAQVLSPLVEMFGVANLDEAVLASGVSPNTSVLILSPALPWERSEIIARGFLPWISSLEEAIGYQEAALKLGLIAPIHLKIDTGMGRCGVLPEKFPALLNAVREMRNLRLEGISTHFPSADEDREFTVNQIEEFKALAALPGPLRWIHAQNSAGILGYEILGTNLARAGLALYGVSPLAEMQQKLQPVLTWKSRLTLCHELPTGHGVSYGRTFITQAPTRVATVAVGYADGYQRHLSGSGASVLVRGTRCTVLGRVTMDQIIVDITHLLEVESGEEVVLLGSQGTEVITATELANRARTIPWEIFTGIGSRVHRILT